MLHIVGMRTLQSYLHHRNACFIFFTMKFEIWLGNNQVIAISTEALSFSDAETEFLEFLQERAALICSSFRIKWVKSDLFIFFIYLIFLNLVYRYLYRCLNL